jgi:hypothetical protein
VGPRQAAKLPATDCTSFCLWRRRRRTCGDASPPPVSRPHARKSPYATLSTKLIARPTATPHKFAFASFLVCHEGTPDRKRKTVGIAFAGQTQERVIYNAAPMPYPARGSPRQLGPRRLPPCARHTIRRPGSLYITASCVHPSVRLSRSLLSGENMNSFAVRAPAVLASFTPHHHSAFLSEFRRGRFGFEGLTTL